MLINNKTELIQKLEELQSGDCIILKKGEYKDINILIKTNNITIQAETLNTVFFTGKSSIKISSNNCFINGITFYKLLSHENTIIIEGSYNHITNCIFSNYNFNFEHILQISGQFHRIENCTFKNITGKGLCIFVYRPTPIENYILIKDNQFLNRSFVPKYDNELEIIRVGTSEESLSASKCMLINNNLTEVNGEIEAISVKSCNNIILGNNLINSKGTITLRHGNNNYVVKNLIDGNSKEDSGGIRIIGENHTIAHNIIMNTNSELINNIPILIANGQSKPKLNGYYPCKNIKIYNNIIFDCSCAIGIGCKIKTDAIVKPTNIQIYNNLCKAKVGFGTSHDILCNEEAQFKNNIFEVEDIGKKTPNKGILMNTVHFTLNTNDVGIKFLENKKINFNDDNKIIYNNLLNLINKL
jgi:poly(beta-D-mannuronate) lyase